MVNFYISTDSTADLFAEEIKSLGVGFLPLTLTVEKNGQFEFLPDNFQSRQDYIDFFNMLRAGVSIKTSMNNLDVHYKYFTKLAEEGNKNILHFTISYGLAPTMDVAHKAIEMVKEKYPDFSVKVVESHTTTVGQGMLVKEACKMRDSGATIEQTEAYVNELKMHIQHYVVVDDLFHLKRGGRISGAAAAIGTLAQLKVIISFDRDGKLQVIKKVMGGRKKAIKAITDEFSNFTTAKPDCHCIVCHTDNEVGAKELAEELQSRYGINTEIRMIGATIGCHVGPGAIAYVFVADELRPEIIK
ncbi:MAG TPA: DegV family protein [Clostridia bacterium]|nr:DegV family protein [Clostridia bacterium]